MRLHTEVKAGRLRAVSRAVCALTIAVGSSLLLAPSSASAAPEPDCNPKAGSRLTSTPWAQQRLGYQRIWSITDGTGVRVAVIDSGLDNSQPQMAHIRIEGGRNVTGAGRGPTDVRDCTSAGHGTGVTGLIAAPRESGVAFYGVAPGASIIPIRQTASDGRSGNDVGIADGIDYAISMHARVVNISETVNRSTPVLERAVARAADAGVVIVAAAGNGNEQRGVTATPYPAAYALRYPNVIGVGAVDESGDVAAFSDTGGFVSVVAPGESVIVPAHQSGYNKLSGTSYAAPFVTGTVALMLAAHPQMTPAQVRSRLEATADPPPVSTPSDAYGYGEINPYLAVTLVRDDSVAPPSPARAEPLPPRAEPAAPDRHLAHVALAAGGALVALAALALAGSVAFGHRSVVRDELSSTRR